MASGLDGEPHVVTSTIGPAAVTHARRALVVVLLIGIAVAGAPAAPAFGGSTGPAKLRPDFNGDGFDDLAIASPGANVGGAISAGTVTVLYGSSTGLRSAGAQLWHQNKAGLGSSAESSDFFGTALAPGDFDGDGFSDLAIGTPSENIEGDVPLNNMGLVQILYGSADGLSVQGTENLTGTTDNEEFGRALTSLNSNGPDSVDNQFADLAIGAPGAQGDAGQVSLEEGTADGLQAPLEPITLVENGNPGSRMGTSLAAGDFDGDGIDTVFAGLPGTSPGGGVAELFPKTVVITQDSGDVQNTSESGDHMGSSLAAGDFDADGKDDLAIGVPGETLAGIAVAGLVNVLYGTDQGVAARNSEQFIQSPDQVGNNFEAFDQFGTALFAANLGRGAPEDLSIGVPGEAFGEEGGAGMVHVLYGSPGGLADDTAQAWHQNTPNVADSVEQGDSAGMALGAGRFGKGGKADLAIGIPGENVGELFNTGAVAVLYSKKSGLSAEGDQFWHADRPGVPGNAKDFAEFGDNLYSSDSPIPLE